MRILAISGSLRAASSNTAALRAAQQVAPPGMEIVLYGELGGLPHFNPDLEELRLPGVVELESLVRGADALLVSCPEYARGVPGAFKNALDWLVSSDAFVGKPVGLINTSPRATDAHASLALTLATMAGRVVPEASIVLPLLGRNLDAASIAADAELAAQLRGALEALGRAAAGG